MSRPRPAGRATTDTAPSATRTPRRRAPRGKQAKRDPETPRDRAEKAADKRQTAWKNRDRESARDLTRKLNGPDYADRDADRAYQRKPEGLYHEVRKTERRPGDPFGNGRTASYG